MNNIVIPAKAGTHQFQWIPAFAGMTAVVVVLMSGCKSPFDRTKDASGGGPTGTASGTATYVIFSDELKSGGGAFEYPGSEGQSLVFNDTSNSISHRSIRYRWTGAAVTSSAGPEHNFAGFDLMHTPVLADYASTAGRDLHAAGYTKVTFYARGTLSTNTFVKVEVADDGNSSTPNLSCVSLSPDGTLDDTVNVGATACGRTEALTSDWKKFTIPISSPQTALVSVKDFLKATFIFNDPFVGNQAPGQGGVIYLDAIQYEP